MAGRRKLVVCVMGSDGQPFVLIAEDVANDVELLERSFNRAGMSVTTHVVRDGEECIAYLAGTGRYTNREEHPLPDLLLLDLKMPKASGFDVLRWIRERRSLSSLRVVVLTSSERIKDIDLAYELGANSFLTKPLNLTDFANMVEAMLRFWVKQSKKPTVERSEKQPVV